MGQTVSRQDVLVRGERIAALGDLSACPAEKQIDATDLLVLPGAVDTHVHFNDVFMNTVSVHDYYTGTLAAIHGGVTTVIDFSNQLPGEPLVDTLAYKRDEAAGKALIDWGVHPVITQPTPETLDEIPLLIEQGAPTFKCYMTYRDEGLMLTDADLHRVLERLSKSGGMLLVHAEDDDTLAENIPALIAAEQTAPIYHARGRPPETENKAICRCIQLVRETGGRLFVVHLASADGAELVGKARVEGLDVLAETCTHYLIFTEDVLKEKDGIKWICSPPLRDRSNQDRLWAGLRNGRISMVTSDDAAYSWKAKLYGAKRFDLCPNGIPGIETRLSLLYSEGVAKGRLSLPRLVELVSSTPARLFGLAPQKGTLTPGADADIVLFDPSAEWTMNQETLHMATDWSAYDGMDVTGQVVQVYSRGELVLDRGLCLAKKGRGRYLYRQLDLPTRAFL